MTEFAALVDRVRSSPRRIAFPEATDPRVLTAAARLSTEGLAHPVLPGDPDKVAEAAKEHGIDISGIERVDTAQQRDTFAEQLLALRKHKGMTEAQAHTAAGDPLNVGNLMVRANLAEGCVAGARYSTPDVIRSALQIVGKHPDYVQVSSFFIMQFEQPFHAYPGTRLFADCGLIIEPDAAQLADIAVATADTARTLLGFEPRVAMLSFSTAGSASHPLVDKVVEATALARAQRPNYDIIGDVQLDAALVPEILESKAPDMVREGETNVFVFPGLEAGNIGYKLVQRFASAEAIGPILQGLAKPVNDLSRGCSAEDVYRAAVITSLQVS